MGYATVDPDYPPALPYFFPYIIRIYVYIYTEQSWMVFISKKKRVLDVNSKFYDRKRFLTATLIFINGKIEKINKLVNVYIALN